MTILDNHHLVCDGYFLDFSLWQQAKKLLEFFSDQHNGDESSTTTMSMFFYKRLSPTTAELEKKNTLIVSSKLSFYGSVSLLCMTSLFKSLSRASAIKSF
jgi:hypothetical protein